MWSSRTLLSLEVLVLLSSVAHGQLRNSSWYKRYPAYPPYCSTPEAMEARAIPPLKDSPKVGDTRLVHVTSIIRHGARTPWIRELDCWEGYWDDPETAIWDCDLTTFLSPPCPERVQVENGGSISGSNDAMFLFEKKYDALDSPEDNLRNDLGGTCQLGQLLLRGYDQEYANGQHLRNAYVYDGSQFQHDPKMRLLDSNDPDVRPYEEPILTFRVDDEQRTLMSGQVLLRGMFETDIVEHLKQTGSHPIIQLHTADLDRDIMVPKEELCPRLVELRTEAEASKEFQSFNQSKEAKTLREFMLEELGTVMEREGLDCLMTTICTDRKLPDAVNDYGHDRRLHNGEEDGDDEHDEEHEFGDNLFERIVNFSTEKYAIPIRYKDGAYAKLAMGPLWAEIMDNILPVINAGQYDKNNRPPPMNKLALFSGHDTTIMPLLATLGPNAWNGIDWPPYASMMIIEIHEIIDGQTDRSIYKSDYAFRLLLNGQVLTSTIEGCPADADLCDVRFFVDRVTPFASRSRDCGPTIPATSSLHAIHETEQLLSSPSGFLLMLLIVLSSAALGSVGTVYYLTGNLPFRKVSTVSVDTEGGMSLTSPIRYRDDPTQVKTSLVI